MPDLEQQFQSVLLDHMRLMSERIGGVERGVSEMQSAQKTSNDEIRSIAKSVDRLEIAVGTNGQNGLISKVRQNAERIGELETKNEIDGAVESSRSRAWRPWQKMLFGVFGVIVAGVVMHFIDKIL